MPDLILTESQSEWLWRLVKKLVGMLSDPVEYAVELNQYQPATGPPERIVIDAVSIAPPIGPLLVGREDGQTYDWRRSPSGRRLTDNGRHGLYYDLKLRLACREVADNLQALHGIDALEAGRYYANTVGQLRGSWLRQEPRYLQEPDSENFDTDSEYRQALVSFEVCSRLTGSVATANALPYVTPDSLRLALADAVLLGPMLASRPESPDRVLYWLVDARGKPLDREQPSEDLEIEFEPEPEYAADLAYVQSFKSFIDSLADV